MVTSAFLCTEVIFWEQPVELGTVKPRIAANSDSEHTQLRSVLTSKTLCSSYSSGLAHMLGLQIRP